MGVLLPLLAAIAAQAAIPTTLGEVVVTARTPLASATEGAGEVTSQDIDSRAGPAGLLGALDSLDASVSLNHAQGNPYQPNLMRRGFEASPLAGDAQGLAVYVDGSRFNQAFGDTVNFDLIPDLAVEHLAVEDAEPSFGLNALGGALSMRMKDGFGQIGGRAEASAGSFGWRRGALEYGVAGDGVAGYLALARASDDGWRQFSPSDLRQGYASLSLRGAEFAARLSLMGADNDLVGNGVSPVELLQADRTAVFTHPDRTGNRYLRAQLSGDWSLQGGTTLRGAAYVGRLRQRTANGDAADVEPCDTDPAILCTEDDEPLTDEAGDPVPDALAGGPYAMLNQTSTHETAYGAGLEGDGRAQALGRTHRWTFGGAFDGGRAGFQANSELGALTSDRGFGGPGVVIDQDGGAIAPVSVKARTRTLGLYGSDAMELSPGLWLILSGRYNDARIVLEDQRGTALNGRHSFRRFNPAVRLDFASSPEVKLHAGYAEANRAPTPAELSCADPDAPCSLTNFFVADPPLKQVEAQTWSAGAEGARVWAGGELSWSLELFRTGTRNDIVFTPSDTFGRAFFRNAGRARRQGLEAGVQVRQGDVSGYARYALLDATFRSPLTLGSPLNPEADADGEIEVEPGDRLPGIARHTLKLGAEWRATGALTLGATAVLASGQVLFGDEANLTPRTDPYAVFGLSASWRITPHLELFGRIENLTDARYETFGTFSPTEDVPLAEAPGASDPRSLSPAAPRRAFVGIRVKY